VTAFMLVSPVALNLASIKYLDMLYPFEPRFRLPMPHHISSTLLVVPRLSLHRSSRRLQPCHVLPP
jgi:hypothetical protein